MKQERIQPPTEQSNHQATEAADASQRQAEAVSADIERANTAAQRVAATGKSEEAAGKLVTIDELLKDNDAWHKRALGSLAIAA
jgi:hypothetical protein